jgi:hypothetical protein
VNYNFRISASFVLADFRYYSNCGYPLLIYSVGRLVGNNFYLFFHVLSLFFKKDSPAFFSSLKKEFQILNLLPAILFSTCLLLILVMSTWTIVHPDTLGYHAQTIQWIEKYKAIPGLVHLHVRFGYQAFGLLMRLYLILALPVHKELLF